jgi:hypothetical protein
MVVAKVQHDSCGLSTYYYSIPVLAGFRCCYLPPDQLFTSVPQCASLQLSPACWPDATRSASHIQQIMTINEPSTQQGGANIAAALSE